jgi:hypothetical protein
MSSAQQSREKAKALVEQAQGVGNPFREQLLHIAQQWLILADEAEAQAKAAEFAAKPNDKNGP